MRSTLVGQTVYWVIGGRAGRGVVVSHDMIFNQVEIDYPVNNTVKRLSVRENALFKRVVFSFVGPVGLDPP